MFIIEILKSIIYGIVEGITEGYHFEYRPIDSNSRLIKYKNENPAFMKCSM